MSGILKHTRGPWEFWGDNQVIIRKPNRSGAMVASNICTVSLSPLDQRSSFGLRQSYQEACEEREANGRLIAAAPELLAALLAIIDRSHGRLYDTDQETGEIFVSLARRAIAKATGDK